MGGDPTGRPPPSQNRLRMTTITGTTHLWHNPQTCRPRARFGVHSLGDSCRLARTSFSSPNSTAFPILRECSRKLGLVERFFTLACPNRSSHRPRLRQRPGRPGVHQQPSHSPVCLGLGRIHRRTVRPTIEKSSMAVTGRALRTQPSWYRTRSGTNTVVKAPNPREQGPDNANPAPSSCRGGRAHGTTASTPPQGARAPPRPRSPGATATVVVAVFLNRRRRNHRGNDGATTPFGSKPKPSGGVGTAATWFALKRGQNNRPKTRAIAPIQGHRNTQKTESPRPPLLPAALASVTVVARRR